MKIIPPRYHREIPRRYRLEAEKDDTGRIYFPPRAAYISGKSVQPCRLADRGKVVTFTVIHTAPKEHSDLTPYPLGIIELDDGARITAQIADVDPAQVEIGMRVRIEFRRIRTEDEEGLLCYGYKVVPE